jgi:Raf kinase inhibitor-like YbhB/YbcL family protein
MGLLDSAKRMVGKAMRPIHAGDEKLLTHQEEICASSDRAPRRIEIHSDAFDDNGTIPVKYSAEGLNVSPPLNWSGVPQEARELVIVCEDPDAPIAKPFVHWVMSGLMPGKTSLPEGVKKVRKPGEAGGAVQGENGRHEIGYMGPIPPKGHGPHHYHFEIFALDRSLDLDGGSAASETPDRDQLMKLMAGHVVAYGEVVGVYERT